jgi:hypothetical protein
VTDRVALVLITGVLALMMPVLGDEYVKPQPEAIGTQHVDFSPGGVIRVDGAYGDLFVEGWISLRSRSPLRSPFATSTNRLSPRARPSAWNPSESSRIGAPHRNWRSQPSSHTP